MTSSHKPSSAVPLVSWPGVDSAGSEMLAKARREMINIVQWPARIANSFVQAETQEERLTLKFYATRTAFVTRAFDNQIALEMRLPSLEMQFLENGSPAPHAFDPEEHSPAEIEAWLLVELLHRGVDRSKFSKALPYHVPDLMNGDAEDHSPRSCLEGLAVLTSWFQNAAAVLQGAAGGAANVDCWPENLYLTCRMGGTTAGFGFSPGDIENPEPFFFASQRLDAESSDARGRWILPAAAIVAEHDPVAAVRRLLKTAG